jgi:hypothetical protein
LIDKVWNNLVGIAGGALEPDSRKHAVAIKPMGFASKIRVGGRVAAIPNIHAAEQLWRNFAGPGNRRW